MQPFAYSLPLDRWGRELEEKKKEGGEEEQGDLQVQIQTV